MKLFIITSQCLYTGELNDLMTMEIDFSISLLNRSFINIRWSLKYCRLENLHKDFHQVEI